MQIGAAVSFKLGKNRISAVVIEVNVKGDPEKLKLKTPGGNTVLRNRKSVFAA